MSSTATTYINSINTNYPVPGVDNDTQGFRDNYSNIKSSLSTLAGEVGNLQLNGVITNNSNDFSYQGTLYRPIIRSAVSYVNDIGAVTTNQSISVVDSSYHTANITGTINFDVENWGGSLVDGKMSSVVLEISNSSGSAAYANFSNAIGGGSLKKDVSLPITVANSATIFVEMWTVDNGTTVYLRQLGGSFV